ncbi:unnamed protein product [Gongylonema pulchrum]|uniref:EF1_GNE domain-containing protein n=1 Tax=Gongylonema pulchrum TaxID=637853 RepID=A0A183DW43_9BILA|nr:unnamed protein product [Gongylonema pulchrum]
MTFMAYEERKAKKPASVAKSNIIFDVKPWDDSIEMADIEKNIRAIETDGLVWGTAKVLPVAYGIKKLQICCVVEDEKVSSDWLEEQITGFEELVQSVDIVAFNKLTEEIMKARKNASDASLLLSLQQLSLIDSAMQFFIPTSIIPYLDRELIEQNKEFDVAGPMSILYDDESFRKKQLLKAADVFNALIESCEALSNSVAKNYLIDYIFLNEQLLKAADVFNALIESCEALSSSVAKNYLIDYIFLNEQLIKLGERKMEAKYKKIIAYTFRRPTVMLMLFRMLARKQPVWMTKALGIRQTMLFLLDEFGISNLITAITEGPDCFSNVVFTMNLSRTLAKKPSGMEEMKYFGLIKKQFFHAFEANCHVDALPYAGQETARMDDGMA